MTTTNGNGAATTALAPAKKPAPLQVLQAEFEKWKPTLRAVLPKHLDAERIIKMATAAFMRSEDLQKCTILSVIKAVIQAAELGLEVGSLTGEAWLIPFNTKIKVKDGNTWKDVPATIATLVPGYRGLVKLARQSGEVSSISAYVVDEADRFEVSLGLAPNITHVPDLKKPKTNVVAAYCIVRFKDGGTHFEYMTRAELDAIRERSKSGGSGPWTTDFAEMCKKTVVKRTLKMVPMSAEKPQAALAVAADNAIESGKAFDTELTDQLEGVEPVAQLAPAQSESRTSKLASKLAENVVDGQFDAETGEVKG